MINPLLRPVVLFCLLLPASLSTGQTFSEFHRTWDGGDAEYGYGVDELREGGFVATGFLSTGVAGSDAHLIKTYASGQVIWCRAYGGSSSESGNHVIQTDDGGFLMVGYTSSFGQGSTDLFIVKTDSSGAVTWARALGGSSSETANAAVQTSDGGYVIAGSTNSFGQGSSDVYVVKLNSGGGLEWTRTFGGSSFDVASGLREARDGGLLIGAYTRSFGAGSNDFLLLKLNASGGLVFARTYGSTGADTGYRLDEAADSSIIFVGTTAAGAGGGDALVLKLHPNGNLIWARAYGSAVMDRAFGVFVTVEGHYWVTGETSTNTFGSGDELQFKLDTAGVLQWAYHYGTFADETGFGYSTATADLGAIVASWDDSDEDVMLIKTDSLGATNCNRGIAGIAASTPSISVGTGGVPGSGGTLTNLTLSSTVFPMSQRTYCAALLPVEGLRFSGRRMELPVLLEWEATAENGLLRYQLERAKEGGAFEILFTTPAMDQPDRKDVGEESLSGWLENGFDPVSGRYRYTDADAGSGTLFYRLRMLDADGAVSYSDVVEVGPVSGMVGGLELLRSDAAGWELRLLADAAPDSWSLFELNGKLVREGALTASGSSASAFRVKGAGLTPGFYLIKVQAGAQVFVQRVLRF